MEIKTLRNRTAPAGRPCHYLLVLTLLFSMFTSTLFAQKQVEPSQPIVLPPEQAAKEGKALVQEILAQKPAQNTTNSGVMTIRRDDARTRIPVRFEVFTTQTDWRSRYAAKDMDVLVIHGDAGADTYQLTMPDGKMTELSGNKAAVTPFAGSDFSIADLGLEFFHWPDQRLTKKEMKRSRSCKVLESINPHPVAGTYSKVVSWIDNESDGIVMAQAYDSQGRMLKQFIPKKIKKVEGQWQLEEMEIDNTQTGSSTKVDFDLSAK